MTSHLRELGKTGVARLPDILRSYEDKQVSAAGRWR